MSGITVDRDLGAPLHHQIYMVLADGIASGRYRVGEALPTEEQLTQMFNVSRITVRRAVSSLLEAGLIGRDQRRRTVVRPLGRPLDVPAASVIENIATYGAETVATVLEFDYVPAPDFLRERLWDSRDKPVQRAVRVRRQDGKPVMYLTSYVPEALGRTFSAEELNTVPMLKLLARAGARISGGDKVISAVLADPLVAARLETKVGAALLETRNMMHDQDGRFVEYIEMLAIPDRVQVRLQVRDDQVVVQPALTRE